MRQTGMIIRHPSVTSDVFKLISTIEFDLELDGHFLPSRIELFQDTERENVFRCRLWERDLFRLQPMPEPHEPDAKTEVEAVDEEILVERTWELSDEFEAFEAESAEEALKSFIDAIEAYLRRSTKGNGSSARG